jgi:hypothetical protein
LALPLFFLSPLTTEAMLLVDVDFAVSQSLADIVREEASYARLMSMLLGRCAPLGGPGVGC